MKVILSNMFDSYLPINSTGGGLYQEESNIELRPAENDN